MTNGDLQMGPVPAERQAEALALVHSDLDVGACRRQVATTLAAERQGRVSLSGLLEARRGQRLVAAVWGQVLPGKTAFVWPLQLADGEPESTAQRLQQELDRYLHAQQVKVSQAVLVAPAGLVAQRLESAQYRHVADLLYLLSLADQFPPAPPACQLQFDPYRPMDRQRLIQLIETTYIETLDCPQLNDLRRMDDVVEGYRQTGHSGSEHWLLVRHRGRDVGCLLLADQPEQEHWELVYMGLVPAVRGQGWGLALARHAQWRAGQAGRRGLVLGVDASNRPAVDVYRAAGFRCWDRRSVYWKAF